MALWTAFWTGALWLLDEFLFVVLIASFAVLAFFVPRPWTVLATVLVLAAALWAVHERPACWNDPEVYENCFDTTAIGISIIGFFGAVGASTGIALSYLYRAWRAGRRRRETSMLGHPPAS